MSSIDELKAEQQKLTKTGKTWHALDPAAPKVKARPKVKRATAADPTVAEQRRAHYRDGRGSGRIEHTQRRPSLPPARSGSRQSWCS